ncbi:MAG TPA: FtsX-like permease family protein [Conexibacter sp.]|nr:FtsX-like permease family protein [Conexibacter sp.]
MKRTIFGIRFGVLGRFYRWRLREHGAQELLAAAGIAVGVALVFGVLVANTSLTASAEQLIDGIQGSARIQLAARSPAGYDERIAARAAALPGVRRAAPVLRGNVALVGPEGARRSIQLVGVTQALAQLGGEQTRDFGPGGLRLSNGLALPKGVAEAIGVRSGQRVTLLANGHAEQARVGIVLGRETIGSLVGSPVGIAPLFVVQSMLDRPGRVTQLLVEPEPGADAQVARELRQLAGGRLSVRSADAELRLLEVTAQPNDQSTTLFAAIAAMVGVLLALNAMLLTIPERRRFVAELSTQGFDPRQVLLIVAFEALLLGTVASLVGLVLGDVLSLTLFDQVPAYLAFAFPIGTQRVVTTSAVLLAFGGGLLATIIASLPSALDLRPGRPFDAVFREAGESDAGEGMPARMAGAVLAVAVAIVLGSTLVALLVPSLTLLAGVGLALASVCFIPAAFLGAARLLGRVSRRIPGSMLAIAVMELRATTTRSIALAGVGALAVYGSLAVEGAHHDLVRGLDRNFGQFLATADLWVTTGGDDLTTNSFDDAGLSRRIAATPGVAGVRIYQGGLLDTDDRRLWIIARDRRDRGIIPASQVREGDLDEATTRIRGGGWAAVSDVYARGAELDVGDRFTLPTPAGATRLRVAAITTNLGWPPGGVILNSADYRRGWGTADPAALQVDLRPGVPPAVGKRAVARALGPTSGLTVQTLDERQTQYAALARQGLTSLTQISTLLLVAAALAVAAALGAAVWQRRTRLAALKIQGFDEWQLWRSLVLEGSIVLMLGCAVGAALGVYGHALASRYLQLTTGFPAPFSLAGLQMLAALGLVAGIALLVVAVPGWIAVRVPGHTSFQE